MSTAFRGKGNLGNEPVLKHPSVDGETSTMVEMYVYFDRLVPVSDGYEDRGGFWLNVEYWSDRAERAATLLQRGARVLIEGSLTLNSWDSPEGPDSRLVLKAKDVTLDLARVESVIYTPKAQAHAKAADTTSNSTTDDTPSSDSTAVE